MRQSFPSLTRFLAFALLATCSAAFAGDEIDKDTSRLIRRSEKLGNSIDDIQAKEISKIPAAVMKDAKGLIILKQYEAGVIFGAKGGFGIALRRKKDGSWGPPAWIKTGELTGGLQLGAQKLNVILVIINEDRLKMLNKPKFQIGVDATVTKGPTGSNYESSGGAEADILAYTVNEGYYAGATFEGGFLLPDRKSNEVSYKERIEVPEILESESLEVPPFFDRIRRQIDEIEEASPSKTQAIHQTQLKRSDEQSLPSLDFYLKML